MQPPLQRILACTGIALLLGMLACAPPDRTDHSPDDLVDDSSGVQLPPASTGDDDDHGGGGDTTGTDDTPGTDDCKPVGVDTEPEDDILDCNGDCSPAAWLADEECDEVFNCEELFFDLQDCE